MSKRAKQEYTTEFKESAIGMVISSDKSTAQIAKDLGVKQLTIYAWVNQAKLDTTPLVAKSNDQLFDEVKRLKKN